MLKKKLVLVNILQITQKMGDSCTKKLSNYKVPLDNKIYSSKKKTVYEKVFLIGLAFVKYVLHVYPI